MLLSICIDLYHVKKTKINKNRPGLAHFFLKNLPLAWLLDAAIERLHVGHLHAVGRDAGSRALVPEKSEVFEGAIGGQHILVSALKVFVRIS